MIPSFSRHTPIKIKIPIKASLLLFFAWCLYFAIFICANKVSTMNVKVHPVPKKRSMTAFSESSQTLMGTTTHQQKKLRRLPHIFSRVLELPFKSDADVSVEESADCFRFVAITDAVCGDGDVRAHMVEIHPGVVKIVIRGSRDFELLQFNELELDMWRFRLPASTRPERASAVCVDGELVVTVPKGGDVEGMDGGGGGEGEVWGEVGRLVLVQ